MSGCGVQAQKSGGVLRIYHRDSPASMSIYEEATNSVSIPMMAVFNNLVLYDQHKAQNSRTALIRSFLTWQRAGVVERGQYTADFQIARGCQMA